MTTITIFKNKDEEITAFEVKGHANYAPYGSDIVCAAISSVTGAILTGLMEVVDIPLKLETKDGQVECRLPKRYLGDRKQKTQALVKTLELHLNYLSNEYPNYVEVKVCRL